MVAEVERSIAGDAAIRGQCMNNIEVTELTALTVAPDGSTFRLGVRTRDEGACGLVFPSEAIQALMLTLFRAGDIAFRRILKDEDARVVYPVQRTEARSVPGSDGLVLVLATPDGAEVAFHFSPQDLARLVETVRTHLASKLAAPGKFN